MFKGDVGIQHKSLSAVQSLFIWAAKQVIMKLERTTEEERILVGLENEKLVKLKMEAKKKRVNMSIEEVEETGKRDEKSSSFSKLDNVFNVNYSVPPQGSQWLVGDESKRKGLVSILHDIAKVPEFWEEAGRSRREVGDATIDIFGYEGLDKRHEGYHGAKGYCSLQGVCTKLV